MFLHPRLSVQADASFTANLLPVFNCLLHWFTSYAFLKSSHHQTRCMFPVWTFCSAWEKKTWSQIYFGEGQEQSLCSNWIINLQSFYLATLSTQSQCTFNIFISSFRENVLYNLATLLISTSFDKHKTNNVEKNHNLATADNTQEQTPSQPVQCDTTLKCTWNICTA